MAVDTSDSMIPREWNSRAWYNTLFRRCLDECGCSESDEDFCNTAFVDNYGTARSCMLYDDICREGSWEYWYDRIRKGGYTCLNELARDIAQEHRDILYKAIGKSEGWVEDLLCNINRYDIDLNEIGIATVAYWSQFPPEATPMNDFENFLNGLEWNDSYEW